MKRFNLCGFKFRYKTDPSGDIHELRVVNEKTNYWEFVATGFSHKHMLRAAKKYVENNQIIDGSEIDESNNIIHANGFKFKTTTDENEMLFDVYVFNASTNDWDLIDSNCMQADVDDAIYNYAN